MWRVQEHASDLFDEADADKTGTVTFAEYALLTFEARLLLLRQQHFNRRRFVQWALLHVCAPPPPAC